MFFHAGVATVNGICSCLCTSTGKDTKAELAMEGGNEDGSGKNMTSKKPVEEHMPSFGDAARLVAEKENAKDVAFVPMNMKVKGSESLLPSDVLAKPGANALVQNEGMLLRFSSCPMLLLVADDSSFYAHSVPKPVRRQSLFGGIDPGLSNRSFSTSSGGPKLASFGVKAGKATTNGVISKDSVIKCVVTKEPDREIVFRFEPKDAANRSGTWSEKKMADAVRLSETWAVDLGVSPTMYHWHHRGQEMQNGRGFNTRLFAISVSDAPSLQQLKSLLAFICQSVNSMDGNNTTCSVDGDNIFWLDGEVSWSEIIGRKAAFNRLTSHTGPVMTDDYYEVNKDLIHCCFPEQSFTKQECDLLGAPLNQLSPEERTSVALEEGRCDLLEATIDATQCDSSKDRATTVTDDGEERGQLEADEGDMSDEEPDLLAKESGALSMVRVE